jgi:hypothetical protein
VAGCLSELVGRLREKSDQLLFLLLEHGRGLYPPAVRGAKTPARPKRQGTSGSRIKGLAIGPG